MNFDEFIPYDESKQYYNIAYPTKLAFYITAGIPFISTDVNEVRTIVNNYSIGYISPINQWNKIINEISLDEIKKQKEKANAIKNEFHWDFKCHNSYLASL